MPATSRKLTTDELQAAIREAAILAVMVEPYDMVAAEEIVKANPPSMRAILVMCSTMRAALTDDDRRRLGFLR